MSFFQSSSWNFGPDQGLEDFADLENNIDVGDLLRMDTGEELQKNSEIRMEKYQQQLDSVRLTLKPEDLIHLSLPSFMDLIKDLAKEHQEVCREIRRKGRNKIHALKCRKKSRDEVSRLQEQVEREKEKRQKLLEDNARFQQNRDYMYQLYQQKKHESQFGFQSFF